MTLAIVNNVNNCGFQPIEPIGGNGLVLTQRLPKKVSSALALWVGSPVVLASGVIDSAADAVSSKVSGSAYLLFDANLLSVPYLAADEAGWVVLTRDRDQQFRCKLDDTVVATTAATILHQFFELTTTDTASATIPSWSRRMLDGATTHATDGPFQVVGIVEPVERRNDPADAPDKGLDVIVMINPANFTQA